jgi:hypothetical protein
VRLEDPAGEHRPVRFEVLPEHLQAELGGGVWCC